MSHALRGQHGGHGVLSWAQRCETHPDHDGVVTEDMIRARMQEEIDGLRAALADAAMQRLTESHQEIENGHQVTGDHLRDATKMMATIKDCLIVGQGVPETNFGNMAQAVVCTKSDHSGNANKMVEPVAWMHEWEGVALLNTVPPNYYGDHWKHTPLYTAPPQQAPVTAPENAS